MRFLVFPATAYAFHYVSVLILKMNVYTANINVYIVSTRYSTHIVLYPHVYISPYLSLDIVYWVYFGNKCTRRNATDITRVQLCWFIINEIPKINVTCLKWPIHYQHGCPNKSGNKSVTRNNHWLRLWVLGWRNQIFKTPLYDEVFKSCLSLLQRNKGYFLYFADYLHT